MAVAGGGFEHVTAEVAQGVLAAAGGGAMNHPALLPDLGREVGQRLGHLLLEGLAEERAAAITQGLDRQEEAGAAGDPLALVPAQAATGDQVVDVGMIFQRARPSVQHAQQAEGGAEAFGILRQVLQGLGTGGQEQIVAQAGMRANPTAQAFGHGEGDQEIVHRQQQRGILVEPLLGLLAAALRTVPVVAGVITEVSVVAVGAIMQRPARAGVRQVRMACSTSRWREGIAAPNCAR